MSLEESTEDQALSQPRAGGLKPGPARLKAVSAWNWAKWGAAVLGLLFLALYPLVQADDTFGINLLTETLIFGLFAMSLDLLLGYTGLVSFGHAAYFGLGAYAAGILTAQLKNNNFLLALLLGIAVAGLGALVLGYFSIRTSGIYFLMLTLAFSQMLYAIAFKWDPVTGGSNGVSLSAKPEINLFGLVWNIGEITPYYFVTLLCFLAGFLILWQVVRSPFGHTLVGIRDNESRLTALGYHTRNYKLAAFVIAGALGGLAGVLNAYHNGFVGSNEFYWTNSGLVMVMVLLGGKGSLIGPVLGAFFVRYAEQFIQGLNLKLDIFGSDKPFVASERWLLVLGIVFVAFVLVAPGGLVGLWKGLVKRAGRWLTWKR